MRFLPQFETQTCRVNIAMEKLRADGLPRRDLLHKKQVSPIDILEYKRQHKRRFVDDRLSF